MSALTLTIPRRLSQDVADLPAASAAYGQARDLAGGTISTFPHGIVERDGVTVARVSYNGRVWEQGSDRLLYCPGSAPVDEGRPDVFNAGRESVWGPPCDNPHPVGSLEHRVFAAGAEYARRCMKR